MSRDTRLRLSPPTGISDLPQGAEPSGDNWTLLWDKVRELIRLVSGRISFGNGKHRTVAGNIDGETQSVYFPTAGVDTEIIHGLGRVPIGIIVLNVDIDGAVVRCSSLNDTVAVLRCSASLATALVIIV